MDAGNSGESNIGDLSTASPKIPSNTVSASDREQIPIAEKQKSGSAPQLAIQKVAPMKRGGGPITPGGKERSKRNAVKHGIFARVTVLNNERVAQFDNMLKGLRDHFQPVGTLEEILVEKLASLSWRYRRMLVAERAEIDAEEQYNSRAEERDRKDKEEALMLFRTMESRGPGLLAKWENPLIREKCIEHYKMLLWMVEFRGFKPDIDNQIIEILFGKYNDSFFRAVYSLCSGSDVYAGVLDLKEFVLPPENRKAKFLAFLRDEINHVQHYSRLSVEMSSTQRKRIERRSAGVPEAARVDRLLRYSTSLERDFDRTLNQLDRLQRARNGQPVPPPLSFNVTSS